MKAYSAAIVALFLLCMTTVRGADVKPAAKGKLQAIKIGKPIAPVGLPKYKVSVQSKPRFPKSQRPKASEPASLRGLSVTIQPEKKTFAGNGPLAFEVQLTNTSKKPFLLFRGATLGAGAKLVVSNRKTATQWEPGPPTIVKRGTVSLPPGKSVKYWLVVETQFVAVPFPRPLPQPIPRPFPKRQQLEGKAAAAIEAPAVRRRPAVIVPPFVGPVMPCGQGACRVRLLLEFKGDPLGKYATPLWTGKIATGTVDFEVGAPQPIKPPVIGPPIVGPLTKQQAITVAQAAAERALNANYKPLAPVRPPHAGVWISRAQKTAQVKRQKGGGWTIGWTQVPKGKGFRFNVAVKVDTRGGARVQEVFTGYSPR
ncbi:MAG: hypothetical protein HOK71_05815 [Planctomycetaceae bacterium]|nr:hypothetical protein [Planctomycetaceae bacterium]MBT6484168.1 hypothetical protein [Planctomycetaceae bacterium]